MRPTIVIALLLAGIAGIAGIFFLKHVATPAQPLQPEIVSQPAMPAAPPVSPVATTHPLPVKPAVTITQAAITVPRAAAATNTPAEEHAAQVQAEIEKLNGLEVNSDADSLHAILAELTNSDKEIRAAAVESTIQFGSRDAIPVLKDVAANTHDPNEKKQLLDAADFLALPTMTEVREQRQQAKMQNAIPPQDPSPAPGQP